MLYERLLRSLQEVADHMNGIKRLKGTVVQVPVVKVVPAAPSAKQVSYPRLVGKVPKD